MLNVTETTLAALEATTAAGVAKAWYEEVWAFLKTHYLWIIPVAILLAILLFSCCSLCIYKTFRRKKPYKDITGNSPPSEVVVEVPPPPSQVTAAPNTSAQANGEAGASSANGDIVVGEESDDERRPFVPVQQLEPNFAPPIPNFYRGSPPDGVHGSPV